MYKEQNRYIRGEGLIRNESVFTSKGILTPKVINQEILSLF